MQFSEIHVATPREFHVSSWVSGFPTLPKEGTIILLANFENVKFREDGHINRLCASLNVKFREIHLARSQVIFGRTWMLLSWVWEYTTSCQNNMIS